MTSDIPFILKFIPQHDPPSLEHCPPNGTLPNRLLSPIVETSTEILSISPSINKTCSDTIQKSPNNVSTNNHSTINELHQTFHHYTTHFHYIQNYLNTLDEHFKALSFILEYLRNNKNLTETIELIETRLLQMRVKREQIDHLLNHSSIKNIIQQISPFVRQSKSCLDLNEFLTSIQLSLNQKTILIDHFKNESRYRKYQITEYSSKFHHQHDLLIKLTKQIKQFLSQHDQLIQQVNHISICNEHHRQCMELNHLANEYQQLQKENYLLILKVKENLQKFSLLMQSNHNKIILNMTD